MSLLEINGLTKKFKDVTAVDNITFNVEKGDVLGLVGPNGAGKSTTISMISTLIKQNEGSIYYNGNDISTNPKAIQKVLGYVPQDIALYPTLTGRENLVFWGKTQGLKKSVLNKRIDEVCEIIGIKDRLKDKVNTYSGGMKRRLNIGVALLHNPEIIIMDEPTVGIDPQSRNHILNCVKKLNEKGLTVIYTSHYMEEVDLLCNKICIMDKGEILAKGTKDEIINSCNIADKIIVRFDRVTSNIIEDLKQLPNVLKVSQEKEDIIMKVSSNVTFKEIVSKISKSNNNVLSFEVKKPSLESVFLHLTGKELRD